VIRRLRRFAKTVVFNILNHSDDLHPGRVRTLRSTDAHSFPNGILVWKITPPQCFADDDNERRSSPIVFTERASSDDRNLQHIKVTGRDEKHGREWRVFTGRQRLSFNYETIADIVLDRRQGVG